MSATSGSGLQRYAIYSADGVHGVLDGSGTRTALHAWDDEALLNEILGRIDNEIVLLGVTRTDDVAVIEIVGDEYPSLTNSAVPARRVRG